MRAEKHSRETKYDFPATREHFHMGLGFEFKTRKMMYQAIKVCVS